MPPAWMRILAVAVVSVLALVVLVVHEGNARDTGAEIVMPMQPVDPQSLLSGHYVAITLSEQLALGQPCPPGAETGIQPNFDPSMRRPRWVALAPGGGHTRVAGVADTQAAAKRFAGVTARGDAYCVASVPPDVNGFVETWLGVDRFHLEEGEAKRISDAISATSESPMPVAAILSVDADGHARMKGLMAGAQRIAPGWY